jgi:hypothetical protein
MRGHGVEVRFEMRFVLELGVEGFYVGRIRIAREEVLVFSFLTSRIGSLIGVCFFLPNPRRQRRAAREIFSMLFFS